MSERGVEEREESTITAEKVSDWTRDLSGLILVQRARVLNLKSQAEIEEAQLKLASLESLLSEAIIAEVKKHEDKTSRSSRSRVNQKLEQLKSRLREAIIDQGARVRKLEGKMSSSILHEVIYLIIINNLY